MGRQRAVDPALGVEPIEVVLADPGGQDLDRDLAVELGVEGPIDNAEAAPTDLLIDSVSVPECAPAQS